MKKLIFVLFVFISLLIAFFVVKEQTTTSPEKAPIPSLNLPPEVLGSQQINTTEGSISIDETDATLLMALLPNESLISSNSIDFDKDKFGDQIIAVKSSESPYIQIVIGLYNPVLSTYERAYVLTTEITQARTFSFTVMDITGTHENALIINGYSNNNESILQAWLPKKDVEDGFDLELIADLKAEGIIFIQQLNRTASYVFSTTGGNSFPIWAYTSDPIAKEESLDQLHIMYDWDMNMRKYVQKTRTRIAGKTINAQELRKIQDGTEKTFATFLDTLWAKPTGIIEDIPYLFFDYAEKEISFLQGDTAEVYSWEQTAMRRNGVLIYSLNKTIPNLSRKIDIALISVDEIRIKVTDALNMTITSASLWDGNYKKKNNTSSMQNIKENDSEILKLLQTDSRTSWKGDNDYNINFSGSIYTANSKTSQETGVFTIFEVQGENILQFRSKSSGGSLTSFYRPEIVYSENPSENLMGTQLILSPIKIHAGKIEPIVDKILTFELISTD